MCSYQLVTMLIDGGATNGDKSPNCTSTVLSNHRKKALGEIPAKEK